MTMLKEIVVLLVEDDAALAQATRQALELAGAQVFHAPRADVALERIDRDFAGVVVSDVRLPGMDGIAFFERLREIDASIPVILVTGHGDVDMAVDAMRDGAFDFLSKPYSAERLETSIAQASAHRALVLENRALRDRLDRSREIPGNSPASERLRTLVSALAQTDVDIVVTGAGGTGKSHIAALIHDLGHRSSRPLITIDAGTALHPDAELLLFGRDPGAGLSHTGLIERARGGTLVLDEIEEVDGSLRARLNGLAESRMIRPLGAERPRRIDLRIVEILGPDSRFGSHAILHRSAPIEIPLPTLEDRREDIPEFFGRFVAEHERDFDIECGAIGPEIINHIRTHDWADNLRELKLFAKTLVLGAATRSGDMADGQGTPGLRAQVAEFEKAVIEQALRTAKGNIGTAESILAIPTKTLYDKLARYGLKAKDFR